MMLHVPMENVEGAIDELHTVPEDEPVYPYAPEVEKVGGGVRCAQGAGRDRSSYNGGRRHPRAGPLLSLCDHVSDQAGRMGILARSPRWPFRAQGPERSSN